MWTLRAVKIDENGVPLGPLGTTEGEYTNFDTACEVAGNMTKIDADLNIMWIVEPI